MSKTVETIIRELLQSPPKFGVIEFHFSDGRLQYTKTSVTKKICQNEEESLSERRNS